MPSDESDSSMTHFPPEAAIVEAASQQIRDLRRTYDYDTHEYTIEILVLKFSKEEVYIPNYQRGNVWDHTRKSRLIESILLGIPIPYLVFADRADGRLEVVDGGQRIQTLVEFCQGRHILDELDKLDLINGFSFSDLPLPYQRRFLNTSLRTIHLHDTVDETYRFDLFERINTSPLVINAAELRRGAFPGPFMDLIVRMADDPLFKEMTPMRSGREERRERQELLVRYYAYVNDYDRYQKTVRAFLDSFVQRSNELLKLNSTLIQTFQNELQLTLRYVKKHFPFGFRKSADASSVPRARFEAIAVGVALALRKWGSVQDPVILPASWIDEKEFREVVSSDAANNASRFFGRINFVKDKLVGT